jgi:hypothetical protein
VQGQRPAGVQGQRPAGVQGQRPAGVQGQRPARYQPPHTHRGVDEAALSARSPPGASARGRVP